MARIPTVHPHACGDFADRNSASAPSTGTPPRVWGLPFPNGRQTSYVTVHPHACGDFSSSYLSITNSRGTPPRVWGLRLPRSASHHRYRYTPTRVGTSSLSVERSPTIPVHPHACGDFQTAPPARRPPSGTPPRVWGLQVGRRACRRLFAVHPHACGDFVDQRILGDALFRYTPTRVGTSARVMGSESGYCGTPPRVWGLLP